MRVKYTMTEYHEGDAIGAINCSTYILQSLSCSLFFFNFFSRICSVKKKSGCWTPKKRIYLYKEVVFSFYFLFDCFLYFVLFSVC